MTGCADADKKSNSLTSDDVIYFIMTDRFYNGDAASDEYFDVDPSNPTAYHGGDLQGIIDKLDYIED